MEITPFNLSLPAETIDELLLWLDDKQDVIIKQADLLSGTGQSTTATMTQKAITDAINAGYLYKGIATPATNPGTPDANVFYLASEAGTYTNFGGIVINEGEVCALVWNGTWAKQVTGAATADQLDQLGQNVKDDFSKTDYELSSSNYTPRITIVEDLIVLGTKIARNTNFKTIFIKVFQGIKIKPISVGDNPYTGFTSHIPEVDEAVSDYHFYSASDFVNATIESSIDGYFCVSIGKSYSVSLSIIAEGLAKQFTLLSEDEQEVKDTLKYNITTDDIIPTTTAIVGLIPTGVGIKGNANYTTDYCRVMKGQQVKFTSAYSGYYTAFTKNIPERDEATYDYLVLANSSAALAAYIISPFDGYFCIGRNDSNIPQLKLINHGLQVQINEITNNTDYNAYFPKYLYDVDNSARQVLQRIRIESLIDKRLKLDINKGNGFLVHKFGSNTSTVETQSRDISVGLGNTELKSDSVDIITTKSSAITGKLVKYLAIGDSWCAMNADNDLHGNTATPWNYECAALNDFIKTQIDLNDDTSKMISIGFASNSNIPDRTLTYKERTYTLRSRNEGRGGWSTQTYLRHPVNVRQPGAGDMNGKVAWDAIGLGRKQPYGGTYDESATYTDYTGSIAQITEYLTTAMGYYHWDYSTELMNWLGITGTYSGTVEQKTAIDAAMVEMLNYRYQGNPFFDWDTAINSHGAYAFSLAKYLERFKTREEDGVTPLVRGETAGTQVAYASQINDYAVCTPTHITIELGINDWRELSINQRASDIEMIAQRIHAHDSGIKVGIVQVHIPGSFYPSMYSNEGMFRTISDWHIENYTKPLFDLNKKLSDDVNNYQGVSGVYYVPTYFVEGNLSSGAAYCEDSVGNELLLDGTDNLHASLNEHLEIGSQIFSWLVYTLSQS